MFIAGERTAREKTSHSRAKSGHSPTPQVPSAANLDWKTDLRMIE
jgi:hypothetical protein